MSSIEELKRLIDASALEDKHRLKKQLDLLAKLPGEYNEQVFDKLYELASYDPRAVEVFIQQFIDTTQRILNK
jgi:ABC-type oligopeptide transport system substrate-binding subunit